MRWKKGRVKSKPRNEGQCVSGRGQGDEKREREMGNRGKIGDQEGGKLRRRRAKQREGECWRDDDLWFSPVC